MKKLLLTALSLMTVGIVSAQSKASMVIDADNHKGEIDRNIYGHFAEHLGNGIYGGIWVGKDSSIPNTNGYRNDVVNALKRLEIPNLRWPGGCFADEYHWMDGIGPKENRARMINTHWGGVVEDNSFGTHEFLNLCELLGTEPYICGNVGSGSVEEMADWVEYITFDGESPMAKLRRENGREKPWKVKFWGVGNENWGCGGNMRPEYYIDLYRRYATYCRNYGDNRLFKVAGGPNVDDYNWTEVCMKNGAWMMNGLSLHNYTIPTGDWGKKGSATEYTTEQYLTTIRHTLRMDELLTRHSDIMDRYDPQKRVALVVDEWGIWTDVEPGTNPGFLYQQSTMRDAIVAGLNFNIFHNHNDRVKIANIAQMVNVLQAIILTKDDKMLLTPTYYAFEMYKPHMDATLVESRVECPELTIDNRKFPSLSVSTSVKDGVMTVSIVNIDPSKYFDLNCEVRGAKYGTVSGQVLASSKLQDHNTFESPNVVMTKPLSGAKLSNGTLTARIPAASVVTFTLK